jgi:hypothetical protein
LAGGPLLTDQEQQVLLLLLLLGTALHNVLMAGCGSTAAVGVQRRQRLMVHVVETCECL